MSIRILNNFINVAAKYGMPVHFLRRVIDDYDIQFKSGYGSDNVSQFWNEMRLYKGTWNGLQRSTLADLGSVLNLYHEATHAVMDIDDVTDWDWFRNAQFYYIRAKLDNGDKVHDTETVVDEVAAEYVGHRAVTVWKAWTRLDTLAFIQRSVAKGKTTVDAAKKLILSDLPIPVDYDRAMQRIYFGYQPDGDSQRKVMKPIYSGLLPYCDRLLENKISSHFNQMRQLRLSFETMLKSMRMFPPLAEAMLHTNYPRSYSIGHPGS